MMRFTCERCGKRYAARQIEPVPGRIYRLKCKGCGHVITANGSDAVRAAETGQVAASEPSALSPALDAAPPMSASESAFLDASPLSAPEREAAARPDPGAPRDPFSLESIVERWPVEVTGSHPLVGTSPAGESTPAALADGAREPAEPGASKDSVRTGAAPPHAERGPAKAAPRDPARRRSRVPVVVLSIGLLAGVAWVASRAFLQEPPPSAQRTAESAGAAPTPPVKGTEVDTARIPPSAEPGAAAPTAPDATEAAPEPVPEVPPSPGESTAEARSGSPASEPSAAPAPPTTPTAKRPAASSLRPPAPAPRPASKSAPRGAKVAKLEAGAGARGAAPKAAAGVRPGAAPVSAAAPSPAAPPAAVTPSVQTPPAPAAAAVPAPAQPEPDDASEPAPAERLTPEAIHRVLGGGRKAFDACLRNPSRGLDRPLGARQVTLRFTVAPEGTVGYPTIDDVAVSSAQVGQCLKAAARSLKFPPFEGDPVTVDQPVAIPAK